MSRLDSNIERQERALNASLAELARARQLKASPAILAMIETKIRRQTANRDASVAYRALLQKGK